MRKPYGMSLVLSSALLALSANAFAGCADFIDSAIFHGRGLASLELSLMTMQGNGLSTALTPYYAGTPGLPSGVEIARWTLGDPGEFYIPQLGEFLYSDRLDRGRAGNPFAINAVRVSMIGLGMNGEVSIMTWSPGPFAPVTTITSAHFLAECLNNVLYGWGPPIDQLDGPKTVLYVISLRGLS